MPTVKLSDRAILRATGPDAEALLQNVITIDLATLGEREARPGALLTPQGKILFDFLISRAGPDSFRLDCRRDIAPDLLKRMMLYRLRAKAELSLDNESLISTSWESDSSVSQTDSTSVFDRRFPETLQVIRNYGTSPAESGDASAWDLLRIEHACPRAARTTNWEMLSRTRSFSTRMGGWA